MRKLLTLDGRDEVSVGVSLQEAQAIERCLKAEKTVTPGGMQRVRVIHFIRRAPRTLGSARQMEHSLEVRAIERSGAPDRVLLELKRVLADETRQLRIELPRRALRPVLRRHALQELMPGAPDDLVPAMAIESTRRNWKSTAGWMLTIDRDIAFHRVDPRMLERTGQIALGVPDRFADGRVHLCLKPCGMTVPTWLEQVVRSSTEWNLAEDGLTLVAPRPSQRGPNPELRLVLH